MKLNQINDYFTSDEKMVELLNALQNDCFNYIDEVTQKMVTDELTTFELRETKTKLTAIVAFLQPIYSKALSLKKQQEYRFYSNKKNERTQPTSQEKFADASTTKEAKDSVGTIRGVRDLLCGYILSANGLIYDCKDRIEGNRREYHNVQEEN